MTGLQLKKSILQLAMQGKLVPQDPNDEPASVLITRIRKEKEQLLKEGKLKKKDLVSTPISEEEEPFEIPQSWAWCRLGDIGSWGSGATPAKGKPEYYTNGNIPWLRTGELNNDYVYDSEIKVTQAALENCSLRMCSKGDVLIAMYGATIGKVAIAGIELTTNQACCACTPIQISNEYLMWYLMASKQSFIELGEGGAQPNISREKIVAFPFAVPPLAEQKRIVDKIKTLIPFIEEYNKAQLKLGELNANLPDVLKKSILQESIQGKLVPQIASEGYASELLLQIEEEKLRLLKEGTLKKKDLDSTPITEEEIPFEIPETWEWVRLEQLALMYTGNSISESEKNSKFTNTEGMFYIGTKDVGFNHQVDYKNGVAIPDKYLLDFRIASAYSALMCIEGGSAGRKIALIDRDVCFGNKLCCFTSYYSYIKFLYYYLQSPDFFDLFNRSKNGIIGGVSIKNLKQLLVPLPPLAEQRRIVAKIEELLALIGKL